MLRKFVSEKKINIENKEKFNCFFCFFPMIFLIFLCMFNIKDNMLIKIVGDEYGYWSAGAYLTGRDWSGITSYNSYYSYGYGIWLALILSLNLPAVLSYRLALLLNAFFLCGIYFIIYKLISEYCKIESPILNVLLALVITLYTGNLYYTQYTMAEVLISLIYWGIIYCSCKLLERVTLPRALIYIFLVAYLFIVHQRTIGVCFVSIIFFIFVMCRNRINPKWAVTFVMFAFFVLFFFLKVKMSYQNAFFSGGEGVNLSGNDFSGQTSKIKYVLSPHGMWMFIKAYVGKIFYACSSTNLLVGVAFWAILLRLGKSIKDLFGKKQWFDNSIIIMLYLALNTVIMMAVGSVFMANYYARFDVVIYGRYFDFTLSPLVLIALIYMINNIKETRKVFYPALICVYFVIAILINHILIYQDDFSALFLSCPGVSDVIIYLEYRKDVLLFVALKSVVIFLIIAIALFKWHDNQKIYVAIMIFISLGSICSSQYVYKNGCLSWSVPQNIEEIKLADFICSKGIQEELYYYVGEDVLQADYLQFLLKDDTIHGFDKTEISDCIGKEKYILTPKNTEITFDLEDHGYEIVRDSKVLNLWEKQY